MSAKLTVTGDVMPQYLVAIHHPDNFDPFKESEATVHAIDALNEEMIKAGVRKYANGLQPVSTAKSIRTGADRKTVVSDGPYMKGHEHVGGFWILECANMDEAVEWGRKATLACRTPVEVRPFYELPRGGRG